MQTKRCPDCGAKLTWLRKHSGERNYCILCGTVLGVSRLATEMRLFSAVDGDGMYLQIDDRMDFTKYLWVKQRNMQVFRKRIWSRMGRSEAMYYMVRMRDAFLSRSGVINPDIIRVTHEGGAGREASWCLKGDLAGTLLSRLVYDHSSNIGMTPN